MANSFVYRTIRPLAVITAALVLSVLLVFVPEPEPAAAWSTDGTWQEDTVDNCGSILGLPSSLLGVVTGSNTGIQAAAVGGTAAAPVMSSATGASTVTAGGALASAGSAAAMVGVGLLGFCGTFNLLNWATGEPFFSGQPYTGPNLQINEGPCSWFVGFESYRRRNPLPGGANNECIMFALDGGQWINVALVNNSNGTVVPLAHGSAIAGPNVGFAGTPLGDWSAAVGPANYGKGSNSDGVYSDPSWGSTAMLELDCRSATICRIPANTYEQSAALRVLNHSGRTLRASIPLDHPAVNNGQITRFWSQANCWSSTGGYSEVRWVGAWGSAKETGSKVDVPTPTCGGDGVPSKIQIFKQTLLDNQKGSDSRTTWPDLANIPLSGTNLSTVDVPPLWRTDPVARACFLDGFTNCDAWTDEGGVTHVHNSTTQQETTTTTANPTTTVGTAVAEVGGNLPEGDPNPDPTPTTLPSPSTVPPSGPTTLPPPGPDPAPPTPPPPPTAGDEGSANCISDGLEGSWDDVNINPITWVRAILNYIWVPIYCAIWWLFVPAGGWATLLGGLQDIWQNAEVLAPFRSFVSNLADSTGSQCLPVDLPDPAPGITVPVIDVGMCGHWVVTTMWSIALALGLLGMAREVIRTVARLNAFDPVLGGFDKNNQYYMK